MVVFNNTNNREEFKPELELESPTIGYRSNSNNIIMMSLTRDKINLPNYWVI